MADSEVSSISTIGNNIEIKSTLNDLVTAIVQSLVSSDPVSQCSLSKQGEAFIKSFVTSPFLLFLAHHKVAYDCLNEDFHPLYSHLQFFSFIEDHEYLLHEPSCQSQHGLCTFSLISLSLSANSHLVEQYVDHFQHRGVSMHVFSFITNPCNGVSFLTRLSNGLLWSLNRHGEIVTNEFEFKHLLQQLSCEFISVFGQSNFDLFTQDSQLSIDEKLERFVVSANARLLTSGAFAVVKSMFSKQLIDQLPSSISDKSILIPTEILSLDPSLSKFDLWFTHRTFMNWKSSEVMTVRVKSSPLELMIDIKILSSEQAYSPITLIGDSRIITCDTFSIVTRTFKWSSLTPLPSSNRSRVVVPADLVTPGTHVFELDVEVIVIVNGVEQSLEKPFLNQSKLSLHLFYCRFLMETLP
ncbi:hypothetical protein P9112_007954 [Eukaryota sp. TZLM1-RC]